MRRNEFREDLKVARQFRLPWWGVVCWMAICAVIIFPFARSGRLDLARPVLYSIGMLFIVTAIKWKLRRHTWLWITVTFLAAVHVLVILLVPWTPNWVPAIVAVPFGVADVYAMLWIVSVVGRFLEAPPTSEAR